MRSFKKNFFLFFFLVLGQFFFFQNTKAFSLFPARYTLVVDPGKTAVVSIQIYNDENTSIEITPEIDAFALNPDTGHTQFGQSDPAKSWIRANRSSLTLGAKQKQTVDFTVDVPPGTSVGSHYLGLFLKQKSSPGQVGLGKRIGALLFLHVSGEVSEKLLIQDFSFEKKGADRTLHVQLQNTGTIHLLPVGYIKVFTWWGEQVLVVPINPNQRKVLPNAEWRDVFFMHNLGIKSIGRVRAELSMEYGLTGQVLQSTLHFWYLPWYFVSLFILIFGIGAGIFWKRLKKI